MSTTEDFQVQVKTAYQRLKTDETITGAELTEIRKIIFPDGEDGLDLDNPNIAKLMDAVLIAAGRAKKNDEAAARDSMAEADRTRLETARNYLTTHSIPLDGVPDSVLFEIADSLAAQFDPAPDGEEPVEVVVMDEDINALVTASGEIVCFVDAPHSDRERRNILEWVGERLETARAKQAGVIAEKKHWSDRTDRIYNPQINKQQRVIERIMFLYEPVGKAYLDETIAEAEKAVNAGKKGVTVPKSIKIGLLILKYTMTKARIDVTALDKAIAWCEKNAPDAVKKDVLKSKIPADKKTKLTLPAAEKTGLYAYPGGEKEFKLK